ncbi:MAG: AmmeMemoRadiSam system radical SAM enzyme [Candidatus Saganbacteria bacterium]|nr:AmmeMemoRadiSam system radical SAM enzyme [Candidatus Saganbacteria bacterium]
MNERFEAMFYNKLASDKVECVLCPLKCKIAKGQAGICGARKNIDGKLYSLIYDKVSSVAADPIEKKPLFHFHPGSRVLSVGTYGCNMRCGHCQNWQIAHVNMAALDKEPMAEKISPHKLITLAKEANCQGIAWTYNEPTIWFEYAFEGAKLASAAGLYTVFVTNGYINQEPLDTIAPYLDAYCLDLKGFSDEAYYKLCKIRDFKPVLAAGERAKNKWNMHVEIVTLVVPTINDDETQLKGIAEWIREKLGPETPWHLTRSIPYLEFAHLPPTPVSTLEKARQIGLDAGLKFVYIGKVIGHAGENTYCPKCQKLLIERMGYQTEVKGLVSGKCGACGADINICTK